MPPFDSSLAVWVLLSVGAAWWVHADAGRSGLPSGRRWMWTMFSAVVVFIGLPAYLLVGRPAQRDARWGLGEVVGGIAAIFLLVLVLGAVLTLRGGTGLEEFTGGVLLQEAVTVLVVVYVVAVRYRLPLSTVGLRGGGLPRLVGWGVGLGVISIAASTFAEQLAMEVAGSVVGPVQAQRMNDLEHAMVPVDQFLRGSPSAGDIVLVIGLLCVAVPIGEELFFRGLTYTAMLARWGRPAAIIVSSAFFAAVHLQVIHFLPILVLGAILAYAYDRTDSLLPPFLVHAINNLIAVLSTLYDWNV